MRRIEATGHRGAAGLYPENTLAGFAYADEIGCDRVELDVHLTSDGRLAVIHDPGLDRTTGSGGEVSRMPLEELQRLDAGGGQHIPSLEEVLDLLRPSAIILQIELKGPGTDHETPRVIERAGMAERVVFTSFFHERVKTALGLLPGARGGVLVSCSPVDPVAIIDAASAQTIHVNATRLDDALVSRVRRGGRSIAAWGKITEAEQIRSLIDLGVDAIGSDYPDRIISCLRERGLRQG